jgi:ferritin-like metal-binding protein YciE
MKQNALRGLYVDELKDLYSAETQLVKALPKMAKAATSPELKAGFEKHLRQTEEHVSRLERVFEALGESPKGKTCKGMKGLIEEGKEMIEQDSGDEELDAGLIAAAQRVEHYEIAGYGCVRTYAELLQEDDAVSILKKTLSEEEETDQKLTEVAQQINVEAMEAEESQDKGSLKAKIMKKVAGA